MTYYTENWIGLSHNFLIFKLLFCCYIINGIYSNLKDVCNVVVNILLNFYNILIYYKMSDFEKFEKFESITYVPEDDRTLSWYEWFFGRKTREIPADPKSKRQKYLCTEQIKKSKFTHKLLKKYTEKDIKQDIQKNIQQDTPFIHTQTIVKTVPVRPISESQFRTPIQAPTISPQKTLHPSIAERRKNRFTPLIKDDLDI